MSSSISSNVIDFLGSAFGSAALAAAIGSLALAGMSAIRSLKTVKVGAIELSLGQISSSEIEAVVRSGKSDPKPFEIEALANYYNQALGRAQVSFWFSIVFATIGFGVIVFAFLTHTTSDAVGTVIKVISGTVIEAVSSLFFIQSTNAQKNMGEFFEKLRLDRLNAEAREMIAEIENVERRDQLRSQLILKYSGIDRLLVGG